MSIEPLESRRMLTGNYSVTVTERTSQSDILQLAHEYSEVVGATGWPLYGVYTYGYILDPDSRPNFDDLLAVAHYQSPPAIVPEKPVIPTSRAADWLSALSQIETSERTTTARLESGKLVIDLGVPTRFILDASLSRTGVLRLFEKATFDLDEPERDLDPRQFSTQKIAKVRSVQVNDRWGGHRISLSADFPAATIFLNGGNDKLYANDQPNTVYGGAGNDTIDAGGGDDLVFGDNGDDRLFGQGGDDKLIGGAHNDVLDGGIGRNELTGGSGTDTFLVRATKNKIRDRESGDHVSVIA